MQDELYIRIPLHRRDGSIRAYALIDLQDAELTGYRWVLGGNGYTYRAEGPKAKRAMTYLHRQILGLETGDPRQADHINRDRLDCRRSNLRVVTEAQNRQNQAPRGRSSRYRGVYRLGGRWQARAQLDGKQHYLGTFDDEEDAAAAASRFRKEHMPFAMEEGGDQDQPRGTKG